MTQEEKQLLLKDLCARLPYGVIISWCNEKVEHKRFILESITSKKYKSYKENGKELAINGEYIEWKLNEHGKSFYTLGKFIKPYLRPMSSMTEKETYIFRQDILNDVEARCIHSFGCGKYSLAFTEANDWLNAHHFDYCGLIEKGLALEAPEDMYKIE